MRSFNFSSVENMPLQSNPKHQFAIRHAISIFSSNAVYSFIPKNACSTMRLSIAISNGCISGVEEGHWIHNNNQSFSPTLREAFCADYTFTILRCPFRRLASVYLDKFVKKEAPAWGYRDSLKRAINLDDLTFEEFVLSLLKPKIFNSDIHWRPQSNFLLYKSYSDYFSLENFDLMVIKLQEMIKFDVVDARRLTEHGIDKYTLLTDSNYSRVSAFDIAVMQRAGQSPSPQSLYTPKLIDLVSKLYADDFVLYSDKCNSDALLFPSD